MVGLVDIYLTTFTNSHYTNTKEKTMNIELKTKLEEINRTILHNIQFLMEEQSNQIQEAVTKTLPKENISKDELWDLLT